MIDKTLQGINLANYDGIKSIEVDMETLMQLRAEILFLRNRVDTLKKDVLVSKAKLGLCELDKPISLNLYV